MKKAERTKGFVFKQYKKPFQTPFDKLFEIFKELITHTSGDFDETIDWLRQLDQEFKLTTPAYSIDDFVEDLKKKGYIVERVGLGNERGVDLTSKLEKALRQNALDQIFGKMRKGKSGNHKTSNQGRSDESIGDFRSYQYGDSLEKISVTESLKNAQVNHGISDFSLSENDLVVEDTQFKAQMSTVLMIDISHSMILYGEDRITPAKKVAMALSELILTRYPKDSLDVIVFGNDAWPIAIKDLPYLQVGPFHTNTVAGVQLALDILRRK